MTKADNFFNHDEFSYEIRLEFENLSYRKIDAANSIIPLIRDNLPFEMDYETYKEQASKRTVDDVNSIEISCTAQRNYYFALLSDWMSCYISFDTGEMLGSHY